MFIFFTILAGIFLALAFELLDSHARERGFKGVRAYLRHLRLMHLPRRGGDVAEVRIPSRFTDYVHYKGEGLFLTRFKKEMCYELRTQHDGLNVRFHIHEPMLDPFLVLPRENPDREFYIRLRYDPMTFEVHEVLGLVLKHDADGKPARPKGTTIREGFFRDRIQK